MNREINESVENITEFTILEHPRSKLYSNFPARGETTFERKTKAWNPVWQRCVIDRNKARTSLDGREPKTESHSTHPPARNFHPFAKHETFPSPWKRSRNDETRAHLQKSHFPVETYLNRCWANVHTYIYIYTLARW